MGRRDMSDGTYWFDHEHPCIECGASLGCDGTYEQAEAGSSEGYCDLWEDSTQRCESCDAACEAED